MITKKRKKASLGYSAVFQRTLQRRGVSTHVSGKGVHPIQSNHSDDDDGDLYGVEVRWQKASKQTRFTL